jgi:serine/threonine protein kinase
MRSGYTPGVNRPALPALTPTIPGVELIELIGTGGSGAVYRGHQAQMGRDVAVKVVSAPGTPEASVVRWRREVSAMGRLSNHPNIVAVYAGGVTDDGSPYLVMPFVPGGSLRDRLRHGPLTPSEVARIGGRLAGALATAHGAGVLHRDMKPENVLLSPYDEPQLTDFGIARIADATTTGTGTIQATIPYAAPEVLSGETATEATDVYGLGATLYACLTGAAPFRAAPDEALVALVGRVIADPPAPLADAGVPAPLAHVVERAMAKDPAARQPSAGALRSDLEAVAALLDRTSERPGEAAGVATVALAAPTAPLPTPPSDEPALPLDATAPTPAAGVEAPAPAAPVVPSPAPDPPADPWPTAAPPTPDVAPTPAPSSWPTTDDPAPATPSQRRPRRAGLVVAALVAFVALAAGAWLVGRSISDDGTASPEAASDPSATSTTPPSTTAPSTTLAPTTTTPSAAAAAAATAYLAALDAGELDRAWSLTSPEFQDAQSKSSWQRFWQGFDSITVAGEPRASVDGASATVVVSLSLDGARQDYRMTLVLDAGDGWLVDGPRSRGGGGGNGNGNGDD